MKLKRFLRHLFYRCSRARRLFDPALLQKLEDATRESERHHSGELRVAVEAALKPAELLQGISSRERALALFSELRIWDTEANNGVLIYLLLADRAVEIVADRGIDRKVGRKNWSDICEEMERCFRSDRFEEGLRSGIERITAYLVEYFPGTDEDRNELADKPVMV